MNDTPTSSNWFSHLLLLVVPTLLLVSWTGCHHMSEPICIAPEPILEQNFRVSRPLGSVGRIPSRVLLMTNRHSLQPDVIESGFVELLASNLRANQLFEVAAPLDVNCDTWIDEILAGRYDEREMIRVARQYESDAILFYRVNNFNAYGSMSADVSLAILNVDENVIAFAADGNWDLSHPSTRQNFRDYLRSRGTVSKIREQSPREFIAYICSQLARSMVE